MCILNEFSFVDNAQDNALQNYTVKNNVVKRINKALRTGFSIRGVYFILALPSFNVTNSFLTYSYSIIRNIGKQKKVHLFGLNICICNK